MKLLTFVDKLQVDADALKRAYPGAFPREVRQGCIMMPSRFAWEVRIAAGHRALEKAIEKLKSCAIEADDMPEVSE